MFKPILFIAGSIKKEDKAYKDQTAYTLWMVFKHSLNHLMDII